MVWNWLLGKATGGIIEAAGEAVNKNIKTWRGDKAAVEAAIADEQLATLASHAAEFASRPVRTKWDSFVDGLNRLPRPLFVFIVLFIFVWPYFDVVGFVEYMRAMELVPETIWTMALTFVVFYFGGRVVSHDLRKPKLTPEQKKLAIDIIKEREQVILENRTPLIVEAPTRKPPPPPWATVEKALTKPPDKLPDLVTPTPSAPGTLRPVAVDAMIEAIIKKEGGSKYTNDPDDSGGPTKWGVTWRALSAWRGVECGEEEVKALSKEEACEIYRKNYYFAPSIDTLPEALQPQCLDICVNSGEATAVKMLQKTLVAMGSDIKVDGVIGQATRAACEKYDAANINNELVERRVAFYKELAAKRPKDRKYLRGWLIRARSFRIP